MAFSGKFDGAKVALFVGEALVVMRRDARMDVTWPGTLDWPGGGRDPGESAADTVIRETREEIGLRLRPEDLVQETRTGRLGVAVVMYAARLPAGRANEIRLGDEGQAWGLMMPEDYVRHSDAVPSLVLYARDVLGVDVGDDATVRGHLVRQWIRELVRRAAPGALGLEGLAAQVAALLGQETEEMQVTVDAVLTDMVVAGELAADAKGVLPGPHFLDVVTGGVP
ncbi:NUDIX domain-containing protein [Pseudaestuariivita atlantica]|uniref:NUDIX domain-containing protein n=1 Tax=Pseudaestuariivita atlantica TaxID=1317121 RepID=UPI000D7BC19D|nr:NUDIX domain-containing protein [Pseudaestuariivita atlantica]